MTKDELTQAVANDRRIALKFKDIALRRSISVPMVRYHLRRAMEKGFATPEEIHFKPGKPQPRKAAGEYNAKWLKRIIEGVEFSDTGCWIWKGFVGAWGYGQTAYRGRNTIVHRCMYEVLHSVKLDRWQLVMHSCDTPACCNPVHLKLGTPADNVLDAASKGRHHNARKTHCKRGHEFTPENTYLKVTPKTTMRSCLECAKLNHSKPEYVAWRREYQRKRRAQKKLEKANGG